MAATLPPDITPAPEPAPQRNDRATFSGRVDTFVTWLISAVAEFGALAANVYANATEAFGSAQTAASAASDALTSKNAAATSAGTASSAASSASTSAGTASGAASTATTAANTATTQANRAKDEADRAEIAANEATAGQINSDWNATSGKAEILNKPDLSKKANVDTENTFSGRQIAIKDGQDGWSSAGLQSRSNTGDVLVSLGAIGASAAAFKHKRGGVGAETVDQDGVTLAPHAAASFFSASQNHGSVASGTVTCDALVAQHHIVTATVNITINIANLVASGQLRELQLKLFGAYSRTITFTAGVATLYYKKADGTRATSFGASGFTFVSGHPSDMVFSAGADGEIEVFFK